MKSWRELNPLEPCCKLNGALCTNCTFNTPENIKRFKDERELQRKNKT